MSEQSRLAGDRQRLGRGNELEDLRLGLRLGLRFGLAIGVGHELDDALPVALVAALDLGAQPRAEALLGRELDPVLRRERGRELGPGDEATLYDRLAQALAGHLLPRERELELLAREQALLDEHSSEGPPGVVGRFHRLTIGTVASGDKTRRAKCLQRGRSGRHP